MPLSIFKGNLLISKGNPLILLWWRRENGDMNKIVHASIDFQRKFIDFQRKSIDFALEEEEQW
jgi:hypothetical protein